MHANNIFALMGLAFTMTAAAPFPEADVYCITDECYAQRAGSQNQGRGAQGVCITDECFAQQAASHQNNGRNADGYCITDECYAQRAGEGNQERDAHGVCITDECVAQGNKKREAQLETLCFQEGECDTNADGKNTKRDLEQGL